MELRLSLFAALLATGVMPGCLQRAPSDTPSQIAPPSETRVAAEQTEDNKSRAIVTVDATTKNPAERYCSAGPHARPISGEVYARPILGTKPTDLDPKDTEYHLYEGAVWLAGSLYFSDFRTSTGFPSRIMRYTPGSPLEVAMPKSGSNGLSLDREGKHLIAARHDSKSLHVIGADWSTTREIASRFKGRHFNSPNDLVVRSDGNLYFTDPDFQAGAQADQPTTNVYRVSPDGKVSVVDSTITNPNGIALSLDEKTLYVAGNLKEGFLKSYIISEEGETTPGSILVDVVDIPDGLTLDCAGNIYLTEHTARRIRVIDPKGNELGQIVGFDHNVTNVAFGGTDRKTLYITTTGALFQIELSIEGLPY